MRRLSKFVAVIVVGLLVPSLGSAEYYSGLGTSASGARGAIDSFNSAANGGKNTSRQDAELAKRLDNLKSIVEKWAPGQKKAIDEMVVERDARDKSAQFGRVPGLIEAGIEAEKKAKQERANQAAALLGNATNPMGATTMAAALGQAEDACKSPSYNQGDTLGKFLTSDPIQKARTKVDDATKQTPEQEAAELASLAKLKRDTLARIDASNKSKFEEEDGKREVPKSKIDFDKEKILLAGKKQEFINERQEFEKKFVSDMIDLQIKVRKGGKEQSEITRVGTETQNLFLQYLQPTCDAYKQGMAENVKTCKNKVRAIGTGSPQGQGTGIWGRIFQAARRARVVMAEVVETLNEIGDADDLECRDNSQQIDADLCQTAQVALTALPQSTSWENLASSIADISMRLGTALSSATRTASAAVAQCNQAVLTEKEAKKVQQKLTGMASSQSEEGSPRFVGPPRPGTPPAANSTRPGAPGHSGGR